LPLIISYLNARHDWELRCAFFSNIVGISAFVGMDSLERFILPCIIQALTDEEEFVIDKAVNILASLCELGLFLKHIMFNIVEKTAPMLSHPNMWIRYGRRDVL
jgi:phosphoinositide-3-kinase regulatory subunit 4